MAQSQASSPLDIFNALASDATFTSYVGEYDFVGGPTSQPALSITTPNKPIPNLEAIRGLEVLIHDVADVDVGLFYEGARPYKKWSVYLVLWSDGEGDDLTNAASRIIEIFSGSRRNVTVPVSNTPSVLVQAVIEIPDRSVITSP